VIRPRPLLVEPEMAELRLLLLDLETEREGGQHVGEHVHHAQRERRADGRYEGPITTPDLWRVTLEAAPAP
jgi:hypothetical protein